MRSIDRAWRREYKRRKKDAYRHTNGHCFFCGVQTTREENSPYQGTLDHLTPRTRGGDTLPENLVWACRHCNTNKREQTLEEYRETQDGPLFYGEGGPVTRTYNPDWKKERDAEERDAYRDDLMSNAMFRKDWHQQARLLKTVKCGKHPHRYSIWRHENGEYRIALNINNQVLISPLRFKWYEDAQATIKHMRSLNVHEHTTLPKHEKKDRVETPCTDLVPYPYLPASYAYGPTAS